MKITSSRRDQCLSILFVLLSSPLLHAAAVSGQGTWETTLQARDLDGNTSTIEAYYDTVLDITWLADANYAQTSGYDSNGLMDWSTAMSWAASLDMDDIAGPDGWRLPDTSPVNGSTYNFAIATDGSTDRGYNMSAPDTVYAGSTGSEMAYMFYNTLGNAGTYDTSGINTGCFSSGPDYCLTNTGPILNIMNTVKYWSATENVSSAWNFYFGHGLQYTDLKDTNAFFAWAVHDNDFGAAIVPVPAAVWLFGSGFLGLIGLSKSRSGKKGA